MKIICMPVLLALLFVLTGCGDKVKLHGKVTFSDDGAPLSVGLVCFESANYVARGKLNPDGTFRVRSVDDNDGLPPGEYRVYIIEAVEGADNPNVGMTDAKSLIDEKYGDPRTSGLSIVVPAPDGQIEIKVDRIKPAGT